VEVDESLPPAICFAFCASALYNPKRAVEYVVWRSIEAVRPDHKDRMPIKNRSVCSLIFSRFHIPSRVANVYNALSIGCFEDCTCMQLNLSAHREVLRKVSFLTILFYPKDVL
jgi:hypothetical protein